MAGNAIDRRDLTTADDKTLGDVDIAALKRALKMAEDDPEIGPKFTARLERGEHWDVVAKGRHPLLAASQHWLPGLRRQAAVKRRGGKTESALSRSRFAPIRAARSQRSSSVQPKKTPANRKG
jgi:hypothetical protein